MFQNLRCCLFQTVFYITITISLVIPVTVFASEDPLIMGVFPRRNVTTTVKFFTPLAKYLSTELNREVKLEIARDFPSFWSRVTHKQYDIVHYNQFHYIKSHEKYGYTVIAHNEEFGKKTLSGAIMVRKDSGIETLKDLRGKKIIFGGGKMAMMAHVVPKYLLLHAGLKHEDYIEEFATNPPNSLLAVYYGQADAAGTGDIIMKVPSVTQSIDVSKIKILAQSEQMAHVPWAVSDKLNKSLQTKIQNALLKLNNTPSNRTLLKKANISGLVKADDKTYDPHRKIIKVVFSETN